MITSSRGRGLGASALALTLALGLGCSKKRVAECDDFVKTAEKLSRCEQIPAEQRTTIGEAATQIKDALQMVDDAGGFDSAPKELVEEMRQTCKSQNEVIVKTISSAFPDCLK